MPTPTPPNDPIRDALVAAADRGAHRRVRAIRHRFLAGSLAGMVITLMAIVAVVRVAEGPSGAVEVEFDDDAVALEWADDAADPDLTDAANTHDLNLEIRRDPVGPSAVGTVIRYSTSDPDATVELGPSRRSVRFSPRGSEVTLTIGRRASPGEKYAAPSNAFARSEPLACSGLEGATVEDVVSALGEFDLEIMWQALEGPSEPMSTAELRESSFTEFRLGAAVMTSASSLLVLLTPDGLPPTPAVAPRECES